MRRKVLLSLLLTLALTASPAHGQEATEEAVQVPIIMYHSIYERWDSPWTLPVSELEADLSYLRENGYETVLIRDLVNYVSGDGELPEKPVVLSFDDGYYNNYTQALPLLEKYDMKLVLSVIGTNAEIWSGVETNSERDGHATWAQLREMADSGRVELANHTWDLHKRDGREGCRQMADEDPESYREMLSCDLRRLQDTLAAETGEAPICFTYPYGKGCDEAEAVIRALGFQASLSVREGVNLIVRGDPECLYNLLRFNRAPGRPVSGLL